MKIFDTHTHLNADAFKDDIFETVEHAKELAVVKMAVVGFDELTIEKTLELNQQYPEIYSIIGWHPTEAGKYTKNIENRLQNQLTLPKVVGLGEIGLDYYWMEDSKEVQETIFRRQLAIAREMNMPVSIHTRDALEDTYKILKSEKVGDFGGIMHSFSGDLEWAKKFLDLGMHISFSGILTFKKSLAEQAAVKEIPLNKLLVETDAPYLTPVPYRGKRNEPGYTRYVVEKISELREIPIEQVAKITWENAHRLLKIEE